MALSSAKFLGVDACAAFGQKLVAEKLLAASVLTPANTGLALDHLHRFWTRGTPVPLRSFTEAQPWPPGRRRRLASPSRRMGLRCSCICTFTRGCGSDSIPALE